MTQQEQQLVIDALRLGLKLLPGNEEKNERAFNASLTTINRGDHLSSQEKIVVQEALKIASNLVPDEHTENQQLVTQAQEIIDQHPTTA